MTSLPAAPQQSPPEPPERRAGAAGLALPARPGWAPLAALLAAFAAATVFALVFGLLGAIAGSSLSDPPPSVTIASVIAQDGCLIGSALLFAGMAAGAPRAPRPWHFGLQRVRRLGPAIGWVLAGYLTFLVFSYLWLKLIGRTEDKDDIAQSLGADHGTLALIGVTFVVTVCAPLAEEFFFRGFTYGTLRRFGIVRAALLTGLMFGIVHVFGSPIAFLVPLAMLGATLCLVRERTGSLYPCIALHCINNSFAMASTEHWDWQIPLVLVGSALCLIALVRLMLRLWPQAPAGAPPLSAPA